MDISVDEVKRDRRNGHFCRRGKAGQKEKAFLPTRQDRAFC